MLRNTWLHLGAVLLVLLLLVAAGQPLLADDTWWHLAMGQAYWSQGPWLSQDPFLFTAPGPPAPAAWLSASALHGIERIAGFTGLRLVHAVSVVCILALGALLLRRASGSSAYASFGLVVFGSLAAYRLVQLRPHLVTIASTLLLAHLFLLRRTPASGRRIAAGALLHALWANAHAGFVLGPVLLAVAAGAQGLRDGVCEGRFGARARRLVLACAVGSIATLANPSGPSAALRYLVAGSSTPELAFLADEWARLSLLALPSGAPPPSLLSWTLVWVLIVGLGGAVVLHLRAEREGRAGEPLDPVLTSLALVSLAAMLTAVRFTWMGIFPLLAIGRTAYVLGSFRARRASVGLAWVGLAIATAFPVLGAWPAISRGLSPAAYAQPYPAGKHFAHGVWFLRDSAVEGRLWNAYTQGSFLGAWLAPRLQLFVNGSLNVPERVLADGWAITQRNVDLTAVLDRYAVDLFFGTGMPTVPEPGRQREFDTTRHLADAPGWTLVFRNAMCAIYLRRAPRNAENLARIATYYESAGVPFDPAAGFDVVRVLRDAPRWAFEHGLIPGSYALLRQRVRQVSPMAAAPAQEALASVFALLGVYERVRDLDAARLRVDPRAPGPLRRSLWLNRDGATPGPLDAGAIRALLRRYRYPLARAPRQ